MAGWPPGYPSRGEWAFRNVRRETMFWPTLSTVEVTQEFPDVVATFSCEVVWAEGLEFGVDDEVRVSFAGERIFAGHLSTVTEDELSEFGPRKWRLEAQDYTAKLGHAIIRQREQRQKESAIRRIRWIVSYLSHAWHLDGHDYDVPDEDVEREDMYGMTVAEALDSVANEMGLRYWVDLDNVLHVHKAQTIPAPFALDNEAPDYSTSFPFSEFTYTRDGLERANAVLVEPEQREDSRWSVASANIGDYEWGDSTGRRELFVSAEEIRTARAAERHGDTVVQRRKVPETEASLVCWEPGLWAGMSPSLTEALWDHDQTMRIIRAVITAADPHDADDRAYLKTELTLNNKPKRRSPKAGRNGPPGSGGQTVDTTPRVLDDFDRVVTPPTPTAGDAIAVSWTNYRFNYGLSQGYFSSPGVHVIGYELVPVLTWVSTTQMIKAVSGGYNSPATVAGGYPFGAWSGWAEQEAWAKFTVPALPDGAVGVFVTVAVGAYYKGAGNAVDVRSSATPPTEPRGGAVIGRIEGVGSTTVFVPAGPGDLWIGLTAGWTPDYGINEIGWAYVTTPVNPFYSGERNSGGAGGGFGAVVWAMSDPAVDLGETGTPGGQGPWTWGLAGSEGAPTWEMDGDALVVTGGSGGGAVGLVLRGEGEDEGQPYSLWADASLGVEVDVIASDLTGGSVEVTMVGQGRRATAVLDLTGAVSVAGPSETDSGAVSLAAETLLRFSLDTRSGDVRAKAWEAADVEPAAWAAEADMSPTEDEADQFILWVRPAEGQTIRIPRIRTLAAGSPGQRVENEWIGGASGSEDTFRTRHRARLGTLVGQVECNDVPPLIESGDAFRLDYLPTTLSAIRADYIIEGD